MELSAAAQAWVHLVLVWVGFGAVVGFVAALFLPVTGHPGFFGSLVIGIMGSCAGPVAFVLLLKPEQFHPMSPVGFVAAVFASIILLIIYRLFRFIIKGAEKDENKGYTVNGDKVLIFPGKKG